MKTDQGYSLVAVIILGTGALLAVFGLLSYVNANLMLSRRAVASEQAFLAAEAGTEHFKTMLAQGESLEDPQSFDFLSASGEAAASYELEPAPSFVGQSVISRGFSAGAERSIQADFIEGESVSFSYGLMSGTGGLTLGNGAQIVGDAYSNGDVSGGNGSSVTGIVYAVGSIDNVETGSAHSSSTPQDFPISDALISAWKEDASADISVGDVALTGTGNSLGARKIEGSLVLGEDASLLVTDTLWVTGDISLGNGASVVLSSSYGSRSGVIIADGDIDLGNNAVLDGSGSSGSSLLVISLSDTASAITFGNNVGALMVYAPYGSIVVGNNSDVKALAGQSVSLGNNVVLEHEGSFTSAFMSGGESGWSLYRWREIPNN